MDRFVLNTICPLFGLEFQFRVESADFLHHCLQPPYQYERDLLTIKYRPGPTIDAGTAAFATNGAIFLSIFQRRHRFHGVFRYQ